ncbi:MAG: PorV/PorQ family protein [Bacteroidia bacterium]|nr:PorV/PorQ family protein [Bacteroidia bacterium]
MRIFTLIVVLVFGINLSYAQLFPNLGGQRAGISSLTFLKMEVNPRAAGLAGANVVLSGDGYSSFVNPAALDEIDGLSVAAANTFWFADINYAFLSVNQPFKWGTMGLSVSSLNSGPMEVRTVFQPNGTGERFYANYYAAGLSYSKQLTERFSWGATFKYVHEQLAELTANTGVLDIGFLYRLDVKDLRFAVLVQNFGPNSRLGGTIDQEDIFNTGPVTLEAYPAPTVFKVGLSLVPWKKEDGTQSLTTLFQLNHPNDNSENLRFGLEYEYRKLIFLRLGYQINVADQDFPTAGLGIRTRLGRNPLMFDYSLTPHRFLGQVHRVGLNFTLNNADRSNSN